MKLLLELQDLSKLKDEDKIKEIRPYLDKICALLFKEKGGPVIDKKRSPLPKYYGVADAPSTITDQRGNHIRLTFDNSTDSGEFEINSLAPLEIQEGSHLDKEIKKLYAEHEVKSAKRTNYVMSSRGPVLREVHIGQYPDERALRLVTDLIVMLKHHHVNEGKSV